MPRERPKLQCEFVGKLNVMKLIVHMNKLLSEQYKQYGVIFVPPDGLITKDEFYAQKQAPAAHTQKALHKRPQIGG